MPPFRALSGTHTRQDGAAARHLSGPEVEPPAAMKDTIRLIAKDAAGVRSCLSRPRVTSFFVDDPAWTVEVVEDRLLAYRVPPPSHVRSAPAGGRDTDLQACRPPCPRAVLTVRRRPA